MKNNIRVNDIPLNERPIEKLLQFGVNTLSHDELLAIVLRTGTKGENVIELSKRLLWELNGLDGLLDVSYEEVSKIKGIKKVKACQIIAIMEIVNRVRTLKSKEGDIILTSGLGSMYPKGIRIGEVTSVEVDNVGIMKKAVVKPYVDFNKLQELFVIVPKEKVDIGE